MSDTEEFVFEKDLEVEVDTELTFETDVELNKDVNIDVNVDSDVDLDGNFASATFSVEAIGENTIAEADVSALAIEGEMSSVDGTLVAAAEGSKEPEAFTITVGDNDGYGAGIPDGGNTGSFANVDTDNRSAEEAAATNGAQITDVYSAVFPDYGPNPSETADVIFDITHDMASATLTIDVADLQPSFAGEIGVYFNGELQPGLLNIDEGYQNSGIMTVDLDADDIARANADGQFVMSLDHTGSGDFVAFDYFELSGVYA